MKNRDACINCHRTVGMAGRSAVGFRDGNGDYLGGICSTCAFYPERHSAQVRDLIEQADPKWAERYKK